MNEASLFTEDYKIADRFDKNERVVVVPGECFDSLYNIPDNEIDLIVSSLPYNLGKEYEKMMSLDDYLASLSPILDQLVRVLSYGGSLCWQTGNYINQAEVYPLDLFFYQAFVRRGLLLRNRIVWHFEHGLHATNRFSGRYEMLLWFTRPGAPYTFNLDAVRIPSKYPGKTAFKGAKKGQPSGNPQDKNPSDFWTLADDWESGVWNIPNVKANHPEKTAHPCQFPIELAERCVLALTNEDDWTLDPFAGSGSALLAAIKHNRRAMACEKEPEYLEIIRERVAAYYAGQLPYRPMGKPVHQPSGKVARRPEEWDQE